MFTANTHKDMIDMLHSLGYSASKFPLQDYVQDLSDQFQVDTDRIRSIIMALGIEELFTGVVKAVEEFAKTGRVNFD